MLPYFALFAFFALGALIAKPRLEMRAAGALPLAFGAILIALMIGLRFEVGADWEPYRRMFSFAGYASLGRVIGLDDPGYQLLNWTVQQIGGALWQVNLICGAIFAWGLLRFCRAQADPWLAMLVAIPYLVIVVAMGYSRQGVAIGVLLAGLASVLRGGSVLRFAGYVAIAALFHRSAVVVLPLVILAGRRNVLLTIIMGLALTVFLYDLILARSLSRILDNYLSTEMSSQGAAIRVTMVAAAALLFLFNRRRFAFLPQDDLIWRNLSYAALATVIALFVVSSSTAIDRFALYLLPLYVAVLARAPLAFGAGGLGRIGVVAVSFAVQFVWLNYAAHAEAWLPYRLFPI